jgi:hypothetical protein
MRIFRIGRSVRAFFATSFPDKYVVAMVIPVHDGFGAFQSKPWMVGFDHLMVRVAAHRIS